MMGDGGGSARPLLIERQLKINGYDIDVAGIVSNIVYIRWFEDLRVLFLDTYWPFEEMLAVNQSPILARTEVEYKRPLTIHDKPVGRLWVSDMGKAKWEVSIEIESQGRICCIGRQTGYFYDLVKKRPVPLPEALRGMYNQKRKKIPS